MLISQSMFMLISYSVWKALTVMNGTCSTPEWAAQVQIDPGPRLFPGLAKQRPAFPMSIPPQIASSGRIMSGIVNRHKNTMSSGLILQDRLFISTSRRYLRCKSGMSLSWPDCLPLRPIYYLLTVLLLLRIPTAFQFMGNSPTSPTSCIHLHHHHHSPKPMAHDDLIGKENKWKIRVLVGWAAWFGWYPKG
jgi:hypothetical protein